MTHAQNGRAAALVSVLLAVVLTLLCAWTAMLTPRVAEARGEAAVRDATPAVPDVDVPQKARDVLAQIEKRLGEPPPGYVSGRAFQNRERQLPRGSYREYDVNPKVRGKDRGAERIVIERRTGRAYYTPDHYATFIPMN